MIFKVLNLLKFKELAYICVRCKNVLRTIKNVENVKK